MRTIAAVTQETANKDSSRTAMVCEEYCLYLYGSFIACRQNTRKVRNPSDGCRSP